MSKGKIEHVNLTVSDPARSAALFEKLLGWTIRWQGPSMMGGNTIHVGEAEQSTYLALYTDGGDHAGQVKGVPLNHVGLMVDDLDRAEAIVREHGLEPFSRGQYEPGPESFYFFDWDGIEFEVASYA